MGRSLTVLVVTAIAVPTVVWLGAAYLGILPGLGWYFDRHFTSEITGVAVTLGEPVAVYETPRAFNGDGVSVHQYLLPPVLAAKFRSAPAALRALPKATEDRATWQVRTWRPALSWHEDSSYVLFALGDAPPELERAVRQALDRPGAWYALRYFEQPGAQPGDDPHLLNVDLFIVDPVGGYFFEANQNT